MPKFKVGDIIAYNAPVIVHIKYQVKAVFDDMYVIVNTRYLKPSVTDHWVYSQEAIDCAYTLKPKEVLVGRTYEYKPGLQHYTRVIRGIFDCEGGKRICYDEYCNDKYCMFAYTLYNLWDHKAWTLVPL